MTLLISKLLLGFLVPLQAQPQFKKGEIVLFPMMVTSGRVFRFSSEDERVGIIQEIEEDKIIVQEIDYPSRHGGTVYIETEQGLKTYEGTHEVPSNSDGLIKRVKKVKGSPVKFGSRRELRVGRTGRTMGYVLSLFQNERNFYIAVTDKEGWACYQRFGDNCFLKQHIRLSVQCLNEFEN